MAVNFDENGHSTSAGTEMIYHYSPINGEYLGSSEEYFPIGISLPKHTTLTYPGDAQSGSVLVYSSGSWSIQEDHRGKTVYYTDTGEELVIEEIGPYPEGTQTTKPPIPEPSNEEKRKAALTDLSFKFKNDIAELNIAWLAAAVSDGITEGAKKDAVTEQIDAVKAKYTSDRAAIIAMYP